MSDDVEIKISRSDRRRKTVSAVLADDGRTIEVQAPAGMSDADLAPVVERLKRRILHRVEMRSGADDEWLVARARELNAKYFDGKLRWREIRFVSNQDHRYGSCSPRDGTIRISHRVAAMPVWVRDYVIVHELAHLLEANHGAHFWRLVNRYPLAERSRGFLMAFGVAGDEDGSGQEELA